MKKDRQHDVVEERRRWDRLPLAIPVFIRSEDGDGRGTLEFASALNISAGGALLAVRRAPVLSREMSLEIPCAPLSADTLPKATRNLRAKAVRADLADGCHLVGITFTEPLLPDSAAPGRPRRKVSAQK